MRRIATALLLTLLTSALHAEIYECIDDNGTRRFTNIKSDARGCKALNLGPMNTVPAPPKAPGKSSSSSTPTPAGFPKVDAQTQHQRDTERRRILEQELVNEQKLLQQSRKELADQEAVRLGSERNYQRVLDRLQPYQKQVKLHEDNIANLKKELSNMR